MNADYSFGLHVKEIQIFLFIFYNENVTLLEMFIKVLIVYMLRHLKENQKF